jgi:hypothetical protein
MWIQSLDTLLQTYTRPCPYEHIEAVKQAPERIPAFTIAEIILLISLTSVNSKVCAAAAQALRKLALAERNTGAIRHTAHGEDESVRRLQAYEQLGDPRCILMGWLLWLPSSPGLSDEVMQGALHIRSTSGDSSAA